jgi:2-hydroxycyclohexanecarboxyl-CoA dehydrogenase
MEDTGRVAVVTGAARGIGRGIGLRLASDGYRVALWDLDGDATQALATEIEAAGGRAIARRVDVAAGDDVRAGREHVLERFGRVDVLVNNAGWDRYGWFLETTEDYWDKVIGVNYRGVLNTCRYLGRDIEAAEHGRVINISSNTAKLGYQLVAVYAGAKAAVIAFSRSLARELAASGTTVNVVCPGATDTPLLREDEAFLDAEPRFATFFGAGFIETVLAGIPLHKLGTPADVANAVAFLAHPSAHYITGQVLSVDGGQTMY